MKNLNINWTIVTIGIISITEIIVMKSAETPILFLFYGIYRGIKYSVKL